jgi:hypothetical protein
MMETKVRTYDHNSSIVYVDPQGVAHSALVTQWWNGDTPVEAYMSAHGEPGCNLVYVADKAKRDPYGTQIERATSVVHKSKQPAHGNYWAWPDEIGF